MKNKKWIATGIVITGFAIGCGTTELNQSDIDRLNEFANSSEAPVATKPVVVKEIREGIWKVAAKENLSKGVISPGTYVITASTDGIGCYWERLKTFEGNYESIHANGNVEPGSVYRVTVKSTDKGFKLQYDCLATKEK